MTSNQDSGGVIRDLINAIETRLSTTAFLLNEEKNIIKRQKEIGIEISNVRHFSDDQNFIRYRIEGTLICMQQDPLFFSRNKFKKDKQTAELKYFDQLKLDSTTILKNNFPSKVFYFTSRKFDFDREEGVILEVDITTNCSLDIA